jgi:RHS repeat-associated protein
MKNIAKPTYHKLLIPLLVLFIVPFQYDRILKGGGNEAVVAPNLPPNVIGAMESKFLIDPNGSATYHIPIDLPPGIKNLQPELAIQYRSAGANGKLGMGWRITGLSSISRVGAIDAVDGFMGGVSYNGNDRFALNGQRLINTNGDYGSDGTIYQTELVTWQQVVSHGSAGSGPSYFTVKAKDGKTMEFGNTPDSRVLADGQSSVRVWALNKITDLNGNTINFTYAENPQDVNTRNTITSTGAYYLTQIDYGSNGSTAANRSIKFHYEARPDPVIHYQGGAKILVAARLNKVQALLGSHVVREYDMSYDQAAVTGRSRLTQVQEKGAVQSLSPTVFNYQSMADNFDSHKTGLSGAFTSNSGWNSANAYPITMADVNGDGQLDIVGFKNGTQVALANHNPSASGPFFGNASTWTSNFTGTDYVNEQSNPRFLADANGDGMADVIGVGKPGVLVALSTGSSFSTSKWNGGNYLSNFGVNQGYSSSTTPVQIGDVNGDNQVDVIGFGYGQVEVSLSQGDKYASPKDWISEFTVNQGWQANNIRILADVNGDKRADIVGFGGQGVKVGIAGDDAFSTSDFNGGNYFSYFGTNQGWTGPQYFPIQMADVNGDGLMDIIGFKNNVQVSLSTGTSFTTPVNWITDFTSNQGWDPVNYPIQMTDVNGDGMADIVGFGRNGVEVALSDGSSFSKASWNGGSSYNYFNQANGYNTASANLRVVGDVDGNGLADLVGFGPNSVEVALNPGPVPDLMSTATDGLGNQYAVSYSTLSDQQVYTYDAKLPSGKTSGQSQTTNPLPLATGAYPVFHPVRLKGGPLTVVSSYTKKNDPSINKQAYSYQYNYQYKNAAYNNNGRGWQGYEEVSQTDLDLGSIKSITYWQEFPFTGREKQITNYCYSGTDDSKCSANTIIGRQRYTYYCQPGTNCPNRSYQPFPGAYQVLMENHFTDKYDYGTLKFTIKASKQYDKYGNTTLSANYGYLTSGGADGSSKDNVFTFSTYFNDEANNVFGYLKTQKVSNNSSASGLDQISCSATPTFASGDLNLKAKTYDAKMNLKSDCEWDNTNNRWNETQFSYDQYGNDTLKVFPGGERLSYVIEDTYHTYIDHAISPPNEKGKRFKVYYGWDARNGKQVGERDANGVVNLSIFNDFGNQIAVQGPFPDNLSASQNMTSDFVVGSADFKNADVFTLSTQQMVQSNQQIYTEIKKLENWEVGTNSGFKTTHNYLDGLNRKYQIVVKDPGCSNGDIVSTVTFNSQDKFLSQEMPHFSGAGHVGKVQTTYDVYQRPLTVLQDYGPNAQATAYTTFEYSMTSKSLVTTRTRAAHSGDPYVKRTTFEFYNGKQYPTSFVIPGDDNATTSLTYDPMGRGLSVTSPVTKNNPNGITETTTYTSTGKKWTTTSPSLGTEQYGYDANGNIVSVQNNNGKTTITYDGLQRPYQKTYPDGSKDMLSYDSSGVSNGLGHLTFIASYDKNGGKNYSQSLSYDDMYNTSETQIEVFGINGATESFVTSYTHDPLGRKTLIQSPSGDTIFYNYDNCNLANAGFGHDTQVTFSDYSPYGRPGQMVFGNDTHSRTAYSPDNKMIGQTVLDKDGTVLLNDSIVWNQLDQIVSISDLKGSGTDYSQQFTYENLRLTQASSPNAYGTIGYDYDGAGNLTTKGAHKMAYDGYQVTSADSSGVSTYSASYNSTGTMKSRTVGGANWTFSYDSSNRLTNATSSGSSETYRYDYKGNRLVKTGNDGTVTIYIGGFFEKTIFPDKSSQTTAYLQTKQGRLVSNTTSGANNTKPGIPTAGLLYFHRNNVQSTALTTDGNGDLASRLLFQPYGKVWLITGADNFRGKFTGRELDEWTGLTYMNARYYDAFVGRFISADTDLAGSLMRHDVLNRYAYALNNPIIFLDPTGHSPWWEDVLMFAADAALIVGGVALIVLTDGAAAPALGVLGAALLGAGVSGALYNLENIGHQQLGGWGIALGVGFVSGAITGGIGAAGSAATSAAVDAAENAGWSTARQTAILWTGRVATGAVAGSLSSVGGQVTNNLLNNHSPFYHFNGWQVLEGAAVGIVAGLVTTGLQGKFGNLGIGNGKPPAITEESDIFSSEFEDALNYQAPVKTIPKWTRLINPFSYQTNKAVTKELYPKW